MKITLFGITWASWHNIWFAVLLVPFCLLLLRWYKKKRDVAGILAHTKWQSQLLRNFSLKKNKFKVILFFTGVLFLFISLMQPQWDEKEHVVEQEGRDMLIALDVSRSMLAQDIKPDRLTFAKNKIKRLISKLSCERVGLILFSGSAFVQSPLTQDEDALFLFLDQIDHETIASSTTALDQAIKKALDVFSSMPTRKNKLLVVFTDGEDFSSDLATIKKQAIEQGVHIFTLGIGTAEGAPVPIVDHRGRYIGHEKDKQGAVVMTRLNEGILRNLSQEAGGVYIKPTSDDTDIDRLKQLVEQYEKEAFESKKVVEKEERYPFFVAMSFICLLLEWVL